MAAPIFSIVVPIYKVEKYLDACVHSLVNQTEENIEIILVDDGSPDGCPAMCDSYARQDDRIRVIHKENGGLSDARNAGLDAAHGSYIIFVDSDDTIIPDTCRALLPFTQEGYDIIIGDGITEGAKKDLSHGFTDGCVTGQAYLKLAHQKGEMPMMVSLYVYRREFLNENGLKFQYGITHEDEQFTPRAFLAASRVIESGVCFYRYLVREDSITTRKDLRKNAEDFYRTCLELKGRYEKLEDAALREALLDSLASKYLSLYQAGRLYRYGKDYLHKDFVSENAYRKKTKCKALLYRVSPRLYWHINNLTKKLG